MLLSSTVCCPLYKYAPSTKRQNVSKMYLLCQPSSFSLRCDGDTDHQRQSPTIGQLSVL